MYLALVPIFIDVNFNYFSKCTYTGYFATSTGPFELAAKDYAVALSTSRRTNTGIDAQRLVRI